MFTNQPKTPTEYALKMVGCATHHFCPKCQNPSTRLPVTLSESRVFAIHQPSIFSLNKHYHPTYWGPS